MSFRSISLTIVCAAAACQSDKSSVTVNCDEVSPLSGLDISAARQAYRNSETTRMLRYREAIDPGALSRETKKFATQSDIDRGRICFEQLQTVGRLLFEHEFSFADGLGGTDANDRPDPFRRVHNGSLGGPETNSCLSCHWRGGEAGAGALQDNSFVDGDGIHPLSGEARNPPSLLGSGVVQALAQEMSRELQSQRSAAIGQAKQSGIPQTLILESKGILFGSLSIDKNGKVDHSKSSGVDSDLVIKPFGWRGEFRSIREFTMTSTQVHLGLQSEDLLTDNAKRTNPRQLGQGPLRDPDDDGIAEELSSGQLTSLVLYLATLPMPRIIVPKEAEEETMTPGVVAPSPLLFEERFLAGQNLFDSIGCALCHTPMLVLNDPTFTTTSRTTGQPYRIDLSRKGREPRLQYDESLGGYPVWLFSDMKRHDLGQRAAGKAQERSAHSQIGTSEFLSRRLWGLGESPPFFYDGRAPTVDGAILAHDGEAAFAREEFEELSPQDKANLRLFLLGLGRAREFLVP